ncbi:MAG: Crp/Fnr family transcriptional regulator, partial [Bacteroidota bacterium]
FDDTELLDAIEIRLKKTEILKKEYEKDSKGFDNFINDTRAIKSLEHLHENKKSRLYKKKNDIYREGEYPNYLYFLVSGKIKTIKTNEDGKELITGIYTEGDFFGYEALLENKNHPDSAEAIENSEIISIPKTNFFELIYNNREVSRKFIQLLSNKISEKEEKLLHLAYNSVRQRTAEAILEVSGKYNPEANEGFELGVSREDLANMVGTATESVIRVISDFKDENIVETHAGKIVILDMEKLKQVEKWHNIR